MKLLCAAVLVVMTVFVNSVPLEEQDFQQSFGENEFENQLQNTVEQLRELAAEVREEESNQVYDENKYGGSHQGDEGLGWLFNRKELESNSYAQEIEDLIHEAPSRLKSLPVNKPSGLESVLYAAETSNAVDEEEMTYMQKRTEQRNIAMVVKGPYGVRPSYDPEAVDFSDADRNNMITGVKLYWFSYNGKKIFRQVGFKTSTDDYPSVLPGVDAGTNEELNLQKDEYITEIELSHSFATIYFIKFTTNLGNSVEAGIVNGVSRQVINSGTGDDKGALLYAEGFQGYWLYEIKFTFFQHGVKSQGLADYILEMVYEIYTKLKTDVEELGNEVYPRYQWMFPHIVTRYCYDYKLRQVEEAKRSCSAEFLINGMNSLKMGVDAYINDDPRQMKYSDYDTNRLLSLALDAKNIYSSMVQLQLTISQSASVTTDLANQLGNYFTSMADFDQGIANQDRAFVEGRIVQLNAAYEETLAKIDSRLISILGIAFASQSADLLQKGAQLGAAIASSANPFNSDFADLMDRANDMAETAKNLADVVILIENLEKYVNHLQGIKNKIDSNGKQEASKEMKKLATTYSTFTEEEKMEAASSFIQNYGNYAPAIGAEDLAYGNALLEGVASKACELYEDVETIAGIAFQSITAGKQDCIYIFADIERLTVIYEELYQFQFDLVDCFAAMVRADVAATAASQISAVSNTVDITEATISLVMMEMSFQEAAHARCVVLEYTMGGKRTIDCEELIFSDSDVANIIAYTGASVSKSRESRDAFIPTSDQGDNTPFINLKDFLAGVAPFSLSLPRGEVAKNWLLQNKWLIQSDIDANPEDSYYVKAFEAYIPNLECENGETTDITIEARTSAYTSLFTEEATATYLRAKNIYDFKYNEHDVSICSEKEYFKVRAQDASMTEKPAVEVCMLSRGETAGSTPEVLPSLMSTWQLNLRQTSSTCNLVVKDTTWNPMMTVKLDLIIVKQTGINECFPTSGRCESGQRCVDGLLSYECVNAG